MSATQLLLIWSAGGFRAAYIISRTLCPLSLGEKLKHQIESENVVINFHYLLPEMSKVSKGIFFVHVLKESNKQRSSKNVYKI